MKVVTQVIKRDGVVEGGINESEKVESSDTKARNLDERDISL